MIRVAVIDDHPALRAGLRTVIELEPGIVYAGESDGTSESVWPMLDLVRPDLLLLDYHLPHGDGLQLCYRIKQAVPTPRVVIFTAYASAALALPAALARADAMLPKGAGARELFDAIRSVHGGGKLLPPVTPAVLEEASSQLFGEDRAIVGMLLDGASEADIASTLRTERREVRHAVQRILSGLRLDVPASTPSGDQPSVR